MLGAIILAGGKGKRFHGKKQFVKINGKVMWQYSYEKVKKFIDNEKNIGVVGIDVPAGKTRTQSVINGMKSLDKRTSRVVILEAARPLVTEDQIQVLFNSIEPSVSFVMPLVNTVIRRDGGYLNRDELYELLTPQAFDYKLLMNALETGKYYDLTDDTKIMFEEYGIKPTLIETGENLLKVTYQRDIPIIEQLLNKMEEDNKWKRF